MSKKEHILGELAQTQAELTDLEARVEQLRALREEKAIEAKRLKARNVDIANAIGKSDQFIYQIMRKHNL